MGYPVDKIQLIKDLRELSGKALHIQNGVSGKPEVSSTIGLKEAKDFVEKVIDAVEASMEPRKTLWSFAIPEILDHLRERW